LEKKDTLIIVWSGVIAVAQLVIGLFLTNFELIYVGYFGVAALMIIIFPYSLIVYLRVRKAKMMEEYFPSFLRDIAEAKRAGMTIPNAIALSAQTDYGPLTKEIKRMNNLLSWGVPFPETIKLLQKRVKYSTYIKRGLAILLESYYTGGRIEDAMDAVAESTRLLKEVEKDRESVLQQQLIIVYLIHFIFVGILVALYKILIPLLTFQGGGSASLITSFGGGQSPPLDFYKLLFFLTMTIQSFSNGLVAGVTKEGSLAAGTKHAGIMISTALLAFAIFIFPKTYAINVMSSKTEVTTNELVEFFGSVTLENEPISNVEVTVNFGGVADSTYTDEYGDFSIKIRAPTVEGNYIARVSSTYEGFEAVVDIPIVVR